MKSLLLLFFVLGSSAAQAKVIVKYTYLKAKNRAEKSISFEELKSAYLVVKQSAFNPPDPRKFYEDYLRFKMGVEVALNEKKLVKNPSIDQQITSPFLKQAFHQELYKALAELRLKRQMSALDNKAAKMSERDLKRRYAQNPEFNFFYIAVNHPINPSAEQIKEAKSRAEKIYSQVAKSKKPFLELAVLYSDDKANGTLNVNRTRAGILPAVYKRLLKMKEGQISRPIRGASGYFIVKLNKKIPFAEANKPSIKALYFNTARAKIFNRYFNGLKKSFSINEVNTDIISTL